MISETWETGEVLCLPLSNALKEFPTCSAGRGDLGKTQQTVTVETEQKIQGDQGSQILENRAPEWREPHREPRDLWLTSLCIQS